MQSDCERRGSEWRCWTEHNPKEGTELAPETERILSANALASQTEHVLRRIRQASSDGLLILQRELIGILYRWRNWAGSDEVIEWTAVQFDKPLELSLLADALVSTSRSMSLGWSGLGDRVATPQDTIHRQGLDEIIDVNAFLAATRGVVASTDIDVEARARLERFLNAWEMGDGDD